jgi:hypothetical protein
MKRHPLEVVLFAALTLFSIAARASDDRGDQRTQGPLIITVDELAQAGEPAQQDEQEATSPPTAAPKEAPPPAPSQVPEPPASSVPEGQWVYTTQYGWIWMPYADAYTYVPPSGYGAPYMYVYYPVYSSWAWVSAPWVWGYGPWPYFGVYGAFNFAWYGHYGHGHYGHGYYGHHGHGHGYYGHAPYGGVSPSYGVRPAPRPSSRGGVPSRGIAPAPYRSGAPSRGVAPAPYRSGAPSRGVAPAPYRSGGVLSRGIAPAPYRGGGVAHGAPLGRAGGGYGGGRGFGGHAGVAGGRGGHR